MLDSDLEIHCKGGRSSRPLDKGGGGLPPQIFLGPSGLSLVQKYRGGLGPSPGSATGISVKHTWLNSPSGNL